MRKDLRVGLGIGGVLLAVLVVALVVRSHTRQKAQDTKVAAVDKPDVGDTNPTPPDSTGVTSSDPVTPPVVTPSLPAPPPAPADTAKPDKADPFASDWDKVLLNGALNGSMPTSPTVTPDDRGSERAIGNHFGPSSSSPAVTPGTIPPHGVTATDTTPHSPATPLPPAAHRQRTHVIAEGETLSTIARTAYGSKKYYLLIEKANPNIVAERLRPGTTIVLPDLPASEHTDRHATRGNSAASTTAADPAREYVVKANDSLYRISMHLYGSANKVDAIYDMNKDLIGPDRARLKLGMTLKLPSPPTSGSR